MAAVNLQGVFIAPVSDLSDLLVLNAGVELSEALDRRVEARRYSAGRVRMVKRRGEDRGVPLAVRRIDRATRERLSDLAGVFLLVRDGRGRKLFCYYGAPSFTEIPGLPFCSASLTFIQVSYDEAV